MAGAAGILEDSGSGEILACFSKSVLFFGEKERILVICEKIFGFLEIFVSLQSEGDSKSRRSSLKMSNNTCYSQGKGTCVCRFASGQARPAFVGRRARGTVLKPCVSCRFRVEMRWGSVPRVGVWAAWVSGWRGVSGGKKELPEGRSRNREAHAAEPSEGRGLRRDCLPIPWGGAEGARLAHNQEVGGSNPPPATNSVH